MLRNNNLWARWAPVPLRLVMGTGFLVHGWAKWSRGPGEFGKLLQQIGLPLPELTAWAVTILKLAGGFALIIGAFVAVVSVLLMISMFTAMITVHLRYGFARSKPSGSRRQVLCSDRRATKLTSHK